MIKSIMNKFTLNSILRKFFHSKYGWFGNYESWKLQNVYLLVMILTIFKKCCEASKEVINELLNMREILNYFIKMNITGPFYLT